MTQSLKPTLCLTALLCVGPLTARADISEYVGRTGLPTVIEGKNEVWMERGNVVLEVRGNELWVTQDIKMHFPGPPVERDRTRIKVAVREDYHHAGDDRDVTPGIARGFRRFTVTVDGRKADTERDNWIINEKKDTATRWRSWWIGFQPGQVRRMRIVSVSPLGREGNHRTVEFVAKDVGHWRRSPDLLEIRFEAPGRIETRVAGIEPKPDNQTRRGARWVYRKASPNRDIFIMLPNSYSNRGRASF